MGWVVFGFRSSVRVASEGELAVKLSGAKRALMDVWEMCLQVKGA
jgi:hypothetical protein